MQQVLDSHLHVCRLNCEYRFLGVTDTRGGAVIMEGGFLRKRSCELMNCVLATLEHRDYHVSLPLFASAVY